MTFADWVLIAVAVFAVLGAIGAFTIAFRRSQVAKPVDPGAGVSEETLRADRSMEGIRVEPVVTAEQEEMIEEAEEAEEVEVEDVEESDLEPAGVRLVQTQRVVEVSPEEAGVTRRQFFNRAMNASFFAFLGVMGVTSLAMMWPRLTGGFGTDVDAGSLEDLQTMVVAPDGSVAPVFVPEGRAYVVPAPASLSEQFDGRAVEAGGLMALFQRCVHLGCRVPWCATSIGFECPCHGSQYNSIGEWFGGPATRNLDRFVVDVEGGRFIIRTGQIIETPRAPSLSVSYPQGPNCIAAGAEDNGEA